MKAGVVWAAAIACAAVTAHGQGRFLFNTHDPAFGNDVQFELAFCDQALPTYFVEVLAGPDATQLKPLTPTLLLPFTAAGQPIYPDPSSQLFTVPGMPSGFPAIVSYTVFSGTDPEHAIVFENNYFADQPVILSQAPAAIPEAHLGVHTVEVYYCPEPGPMILTGLGVIGLAIYSQPRLRG